MQDVKQPFVNNSGTTQFVNFVAGNVYFSNDNESLQSKFEAGKLSGVSTAAEVATKDNSNVQAKLNEIKSTLEHATVTKSTYSVPTPHNVLTYTGTAQEQTFDGFDQSAMTITGETTYTNAGTYSVTVSLKYPRLSEWSDNTNTDKTITWTIAKANANVSGSPTSLALTAESPTGNIVFTKDTNAELTVTSSDINIVTVEQNGLNATVTGLTSGQATVTGSASENTNYVAGLFAVPITCSFVQRIGLLWDGSGFYRVDQDLNVISNSNFDPTKTFPYSEMSTETVDGAPGVTWPVMYTHAENAPTANPTYGRIWWIDDTPNDNNHVYPCFVADGVTKSKLWLKTTLESNTTYNNLCTKAKNTVMNFYDYSLMQKLILIEYNTGTNPPQQSLAADATWRNLRQAWGHSYQWIFGADMITSGEYKATVGNGKLRILNPIMNGSFIDTGLTLTTNGWIKGNFNIGTINGINMGDLMLDTSSESNSNGSLTVSPFANQYFSPACAFYSQGDRGLLGFIINSPDWSYAWRLRKVI